MGTNDATNWERRLKGEVVPLTPDMEPDYGFYRVRTKDKTSWRAMAYWFDDAGKLHCFLQGRGELNEAQAREIWSWASRNPITHELFKDVVDNGAPWPDLNQEVTRHNNMSNEAPEDNSFAAIRDRIDDLAREAERLINAGAATNQDIADQAADVANKLGEYWNKADKQRSVEKQPHLDAGREVDNKWRPILVAAEVHKRLKQVVCAPWLTALRRKKDQEEAEARRVAEEARQRVIAAEKEAREKIAEAEKTGDVKAAAEVSQAARKIEEATQQFAAATQTAQSVATASVTVGTRGRGVHLRNEEEFSIKDREAMFAFLAKNAKAVVELDTLMLKHAKALHKAGVEVPGLQTTKGSKAA